jgi:hypothetical protein
MQLMRSFNDLLPHLPHANDVFQIVLEGYGAELDGTYDLVDLYCQDPACDCYKVSFLVLDAKKNVLATIAYGWKSKSYYHRWGLDKEATRWLTHGFLDPWGIQSERSPIFLQGFLRMLNKNPQFISRIKRRYTIFKGAVCLEKVIPFLADILPAKTYATPLPDNIIPLKRKHS